MAKLKIFDNNNTNVNVPSKQGYINVATGVINDFTNFESESDKKKSDLLQQYAGNNHIIYQLTRNPETNVPIDSNNCKVYIVPDGRKKPGVTFGKHNIVLPEMESDDPPLDTGYLSEHVKAISELYGAGTSPEVDQACKFLFGLMLLTRCR
ncbi:MAG: hypothetical protein E5W81_08320 [Mesorhizobium sp.]|nr:MAG: hypothetical protein E5V36_02135 [Mesorhizobium sp.]TKB88259.1 MAG: hypothetical protein E5W81_08320 [Mesorhizobium sp.]